MGMQSDARQKKNKKKKKNIVIVVNVGSSSEQQANNFNMTQKSSPQQRSEFVLTACGRKENWIKKIWIHFQLMTIHNQSDLVACLDIGT